MDFTYTNIEELPLTLKAHEAAAVLRISKSKVYELARTESFPAVRMGNLHEEFEAQAQNRGNYEKQVRVRGHNRPLTGHTGRQRRPDCNGFSDFKTGGT